MIGEVKAALKKVGERLRLLRAGDHEAFAAGDHHGRLEVLLIENRLPAVRDEEIPEVRGPHAGSDEQHRRDDEIDPEAAGCRTPFSACGRRVD